MNDVASVLSMGVTGGLIALAAALLVATVLGVAMRRRAGQFRQASPGTPAKSGTPAKPAGALSEADLGAGLGRQATLVQFSTAFCAPCRPTRQILAQVADMVDGVTHVEIDAAARLDLVRRLRINSTPTVLVLDPDGAIVKRATGLPRKADVIAALGTVVRAEDRSRK
ncbi:MAG: TlpA family protein disulfide reductase [Streptosporangiaceae bacterium]